MPMTRTTTATMPGKRWPCSTSASSTSRRVAVARQPEEARSAAKGRAHVHQPLEQTRMSWCSPGPADSCAALSGCAHGSLAPPLPPPASGSRPALALGAPQEGAQASRTAADKAGVPSVSWPHGGEHVGGACAPVHLRTWERRLALAPCPHETLHPGPFSLRQAWPIIAHGLSLAYPWPILGLSLAYHWPITGPSVPMAYQCPWPIIAHGLSFLPAGGCGAWVWPRGKETAYLPPAVAR